MCKKVWNICRKRLEASGYVSCKKIQVAKDRKRRIL